LSHAQEALRLRRLGFHPIVERTNSKMPAEAAWQKLVNRSEEAIQRVFDQMPEGGIGTITRGFVVVDLDIRADKNGIESLKSLPALPPTLTSITPSGGRHLFFRVPEDARFVIRSLASGLESTSAGPAARSSCRPRASTAGRTNGRSAPISPAPAKTWPNCPGPGSLF